MGGGRIPVGIGRIPVRRGVDEAVGSWIPVPVGADITFAMKKRTTASRNEKIENIIKMFEQTKDEDFYTFSVQGETHNPREWHTNMSQNQAMRRRTMFRNFHHHQGRDATRILEKIAGVAVDKPRADHHEANIIVSGALGGNYEAATHQIGYL